MTKTACKGLEQNTKLNGIVVLDVWWGEFIIRVVLKGTLKANTESKLTSISPAPHSQSLLCIRKWLKCRRNCNRRGRTIFFTIQIQIACGKQNLLGSLHCASNLWGVAPVGTVTLTFNEGATQWGCHALQIALTEQCKQVTPASYFCRSAQSIWRHFLFLACCTSTQLTTFLLSLVGYNLPVKNRADCYGSWYCYVHSSGANSA